MVNIGGGVVTVIREWSLSLQRVSCEVSYPHYMSISTGSKEPSSTLHVSVSGLWYDMC